MRLSVFWVLIGLWALFTALSAIPPIARTGYGWSIIVSISPIANFFLFQVFASFVAIPLLLLARGRSARWERWLARSPAIVACVQLAAFGGMTL
jgi:hypothetical protein